MRRHTVEGEAMLSVLARRSPRSASHRPVAPRTLRRAGVPGRAGRRADTAHGPGGVGGRCLRRDHLDPRLPCAAGGATCARRAAEGRRPPVRSPGGRGVPCRLSRPGEAADPRRDGRRRSPDHIGLRHARAGRHRSYPRSSWPGRPPPWAPGRAAAARRASWSGRDARTSGAMFARAAAAGLQSVGRRRRRTRHRPHADRAAGGGIPPRRRRADHHRQPQSDRMERPQVRRAPTASSSTPRQGRRSRRLPAEGPKRAGWDGLGSLAPDPDAIARHLAAIMALPVLDVAAIRARKFRVALDCVRGAGALAMLPLLEQLGVAVTGINLEPDGRFPRPPEPIPENLGELSRAVRDRKADLGMAVDPDVDRLALVDDTGTPIGEDYTLALAVHAVLDRERPSRPAPVVVTNLSTSRVVEDAARDVGARFLRAPVGEANVARAMVAEGAADRGRRQRRGDVPGPARGPGRPDRRRPSSCTIWLGCRNACRAGCVPAHSTSSSRPRPLAEGTWRRLYRPVGGRLPRGRGGPSRRTAAGVGRSMAPRPAQRDRADRPADRGGAHPGRRRGVAGAGAGGGVGPGRERLFMCGIVGYVGPRQATPILLEGLRRLEYRGYDSAGIAVLNGNGLEVRKAAGKLTVLAGELAGAEPHGTLGIGHTRWATHGAADHPQRPPAHRPDRADRPDPQRHHRERRRHQEGAGGSAGTPSSPRPTPRCWRTWWASSTRGTSKRPSRRRCARSTAPTASR